jgi:3-hydroxyisobutyrate dehydrogenase
MKTPVAFVGLGIMGQPMAMHLVRAGLPTRVYNRTPGRAKALVDAGAAACSSPSDAARGSEVVFVCVRDTPDVRQVTEGPGGILEQLGPGSVIIDHSTISPAATRELAASAAARGGWWIDAPVSGGEQGARDATLSIMCGGDRAAFDRVQPLLQLLGKTITYCGSSGNGQLTKLVNQVLVSVTLMAVVEALTFARQSGLDPTATLSAVSGGAGSSWQLERLGPKMLAGDYRPGFMIDLQQKDLRILLQEAESLHTPLPATSLAHQLFTAAQAAGHGRDGTQALFSVLGKLAAAG